MKVGVIGAGDNEQLAHIASYNKLKDAELVGIVDEDLAMARTLSNRYKCKYYSDFEQLIDKTGLDAVSICTPPFARRDIIQYAAENNVSILCESPLSNSYSDALEIRKVIERSGIQFMMGFTLRFSEWYERAYKLIRGAKLGEIVFLRCVYASQLPSNPWFLKENNGGILVDKGSHMIDLICWLLGAPSKVRACVSNIRNISGENAFITLYHEKSISQLALSYGVNVHLHRPIFRTEIYGTGCVLIMDHNLNICSFLPASKHILKEYLIGVPREAIRYYLQSKNLIEKENSHFKEIEYFIHCLKNGHKVSPNYLDGLANMKIIEACYESAKKGIAINLDTS
jgi:predicted dehydrogenase